MFLLNKLNLFSSSKKTTTDVINFKIDKKVKEDFFAFCEKKDIVPSQLLTNFVNSILSDKSYVNTKKTDKKLEKKILNWLEINQINDNEIDFSKRDFIKFGVFKENGKIKEFNLDIPDLRNGIFLLGGSGSGKTVINMNIFDSVVKNNYGALFFNRFDSYLMENIWKIASNYNRTEDIFLLNITERKNDSEYFYNYNTKKSDILLNYIEENILKEKIIDFFYEDINGDNAYFIQSLKSVLERFFKNNSINDFRKLCKDKQYFNLVKYMSDVPNDNTSNYILSLFQYKKEKIEKILNHLFEIEVNLDESITDLILKNKIIVINNDCMLFDRKINEFIMDVVLKQVLQSKADLYREKLLNNFFVFFDEVGNFDISTIENFVRESRVYNFISIINSQSINGFETIASNFHNKIILKNYDCDSLEVLNFDRRQMDRLNYGNGYFDFIDRRYPISFNYLCVDDIKVKVKKQSFINKEKIKLILQEYLSEIEEKNHSLTINFNNIFSEVLVLQGGDE